MKRTKQFIYYLIGTFALSLGISLALLSELGAGAFDSMSYNLSMLLNIRIGIAFYIGFIILFIINMILKPRMNYFLGFLLTFVISFQIDLMVNIIPSFDNFGLRILYFTFTLVLIPLGIAMIVKSRLPIGPIDTLLVLLTEKTKWKIMIIKTLIESSFAILALVFGLLANIGTGALSYGTIVITLTVGPMMGLFMRLIKDIEKSS